MRSRTRKPDINILHRMPHHCPQDVERYAITRAYDTDQRRSPAAQTGLFYQPFAYRGCQVIVRVNLSGLEIDVDIDTWGPTRGARDGKYGPPLEPDEPGGFEINSATIVNIDCDADLCEAIETELEKMRDDYDGY
jgi:hypothetical protein